MLPSQRTIRKPQAPNNAKIFIVRKEIQNIHQVASDKTIQMKLHILALHTVLKYHEQFYFEV